MPVLIATPFATNGTKNDIPETTGAQPQNATMEEGFPAITQQPISTGGIPPERADFNGILYALSDNISHINKGLAYSFDTAFATKIGGYPLHAELVMADGTRVVSTIANNMNNPDVDLTGWELLQNKSVRSITQLLSISSPSDGSVVFVESYNQANYTLAVPYFSKGGGFFKFDKSKVAANDGGVVINGWVRQDTTNLNAYDFGAYGDWNAGNQTGHDDTTAIQNMINFVFSNEPDHRNGGKRIVKLLSGNYRHGTLNITAPDSRFSFEFIGDGLFSTVLWCDPTSDGILLGTENTRWKGIRFHGKLNASRHSANDPSIEYLIKAKLPWKYLDIDAAFNECGVSFCRTFARVCGRGFNFKNGVVSTSTTLFEIACDSDLIVAGNAPEIHGVQTSLRHFRVTDNRFDAVSNVLTVSGTHEIKDYINGFEFSKNDVVTLNRIIEASDCTLISPRLVGNTAINSFSSSFSSAMFNVPRCFDLLDSDNKWFNRTELDIIGDDATKSIRYLYRFDYADGVTISKTTAKDLGFGVIRLGSPSKNIKLIGNNFLGFGDASANTPIVDNYVIIDGLIIKDNTVTANIDNNKKFVRLEQTGSDNTEISGNITSDLRFAQQSIYYAPQLKIGATDSPTAIYSNSNGQYRIDGDYCIVDVAFTATESASSGVIGVSLPIPAVAKYTASSSAYSGEGVVSNMSGFTFTERPVFYVDSSAQVAKVMQSFSTQLNLSAKTGNAITIRGEFRYRFK